MSKYYLATNETKVFHYSELLVEEGQEVTTGQPHLFYYDTKVELIDALADYGQVYKDPVLTPETPAVDLPTPIVP